MSPQACPKIRQLNKCSRKVSCLTLGTPPIPRAISSAMDPVGTTGTLRNWPSVTPRFVMASAPNFFRSTAIALSTSCLFFAASSSAELLPLLALPMLPLPLLLLLLLPLPRRLLDFLELVDPLLLSSLLLLGFVSFGAWTSL